MTTAFPYLSALLTLSILSFHQAALASTQNGHYNIKTLNFTLYQHENINKTGFIVVDGVAGVGVSQTTTPFGTLYVFRDNLTTHVGGSSRFAGVAEGTSLTTSFDGLRSLSIAKITLNLNGYEGSISIVGGTHNTKPSEYPVVGGTGDFLYVLGHIRSTPVDLSGLTVVYRIDFFLYWPPYAAKAPK
ncbi:Dirigent protein [Rhynchospora pubera]|uniref:Dirigent protein n=1 Tax=Rhynchospora pubera TaxID=906938 RepID=A0AAV8ET29_9POAL|nr:Dirigent protein [Rhynchospora pubera]